MKKAILGLFITFALMSPALSQTEAVSDATIECEECRRTAISDLRAIVSPQALRGDQGIAQKDSPVFKDFSKQVMKTLEGRSEPMLGLGQEKTSTTTTLKEFRELCADGDFEDKVSWKKESSGIQKVSFSCVEDREPKIREKLFVFSFQDQSAAVPGKLQMTDLEVISAEPQDEIATDSSKKDQKKFTKKAGVKMAVAISASMLASGIAARTMFRGEGDKTKHAIGSAALAGVGTAIAHYAFGLSPGKAALAGGGVSFLLGVGKEVIDPRIGGQRSGRDLGADAVGTGLGALTVFWLIRD